MSLWPVSYAIYMTLNDSLKFHSPETVLEQCFQELEEARSRESEAGSADTAALDLLNEAAVLVFGEDWVDEHFSLGNINYAVDFLGACAEHSLYHFIRAKITELRKQDLPSLQSILDYLLRRTTAGGLPEKGCWSPTIPWGKDLDDPLNETHVKHLKLLLAEGADPNARRPRRLAPGHMSAWEGFIGIVGRFSLWPDGDPEAQHGHWWGGKHPREAFENVLPMFQLYNPDISERQTHNVYCHVDLGDETFSFDVYVRCPATFVIELARKHVPSPSEITNVEVTNYYYTRAKTEQKWVHLTQVGAEQVLGILISMWTRQFHQSAQDIEEWLATRL